MKRIAINELTTTAIQKMSDGNPGAINVMMKLIEDAGQIDPQSFMGGMGVILSLDTLGIYGSDIYVLYNDKCENDIRRMVMLLRAVQLGFFDERKLKDMASDQEYKINLSSEEWAELDKKVCSELKDFAKN